MSNKPCASQIAPMCWRAGGSSSRVRGSSFCKAPRSDAPIWGFSGSPDGSHIVLVILLDHPLLRVHLDLLHRLLCHGGYRPPPPAWDLPLFGLHLAALPHEPHPHPHPAPPPGGARGGSLGCAV